MNIFVTEEVGRMHVGETLVDRSFTKTLLVDTFKEELLVLDKDVEETIGRVSTPTSGTIKNG